VEYQRLSGARALARYYKLPEGHSAVHRDKELAEFRQHRDQRMKPIDSAYENIIPSNAAFALLDIPGDNEPATLPCLGFSHSGSIHE
jgi:hypothetical protein